MQLERTYQAKFDALVVRERNATERLQREQEVRCLLGSKCVK